MNDIVTARRATPAASGTIPLDATVSVSSATMVLEPLGADEISAQRERTDKIEAAVYSHIQALRSLGHEYVSASDIARHLGIKDSEVVLALRALKAKGVKILA